MKKTAFITFAAAFAVAGCASVTPPETAARLGASPTLSGGSYSSGGGITVATELRGVDGRTAVCGVWAQSLQQSVLTKLVERQVLQTGTVYLGEERILTGLAFMNEVAPAADYAGAKADCAVTERPWQAGDAERPVKVRIPQQVVHRESGDEMGAGGFVVYFKPDGPGAGGGG